MPLHTGIHNDHDLPPPLSLGPNGENNDPISFYFAFQHQYPQLRIEGFHLILKRLKLPHNFLRVLVEGQESLQGKGGLSVGDLRSGLGDLVGVRQPSVQQVLAALQRERGGAGLRDFEGARQAQRQLGKDRALALREGYRVQLVGALCFYHLEYYNYTIN